MYIKKIKLKNFRNYEEQQIELDKRINTFFGNNAQGKTNIIEAIFLCAMGKSFRTKKEKELVKFEKKYSSIEIDYAREDREGKIKIEIGDKKNIFINNIKIKKLSEILGNINIVVFSPDDINIFKNGPSQRRRFLNIMISQLRPKYVYNLNLYLKTLEQRNNYIRQIKNENKSEELLEIWDEKLVEYAEIIYNYRKEFIEKIKNRIKKIHNEITKEKENIEIKYNSDFISKEKFLKKLKENRKKDILKGFTTIGIQRDDFIIYINGKEVNIYGSQGQNRTTILSLKLSEMEIIYDEINEYPILLLDDFMSELDKNRIENFLSSIKEIQVLITCTEKIQKIKSKNFRVKNGKIYIE